MGLLTIVKAKAKGKSKEETQQTQQKVNKKGMSPTGAVFLALGLVGLAVFGYEIFQNGGLQNVSGLAGGVGLILSAVSLVVAFYAK